MRISTTPPEYKQKAGPRRDPPGYALSLVLADDPAGQKATGHEQDTGTKRYQRRTSRGGKIGSSNVLVLRRRPRLRQCRYPSG